MTISTHAIPNSPDTTRSYVYNSQLRAMIIDIETGKLYQNMYNVCDANYKDCMNALRLAESGNQDLRSLINVQNQSIEQYKLAESSYISIIKRRDADLKKARMKTLGFSIAGGAVSLTFAAVTMWVILK